MGARDPPKTLCIVGVGGRGAQADLIKFIPNDYLVISESGISTKDDIKFIMDFEVNSFLIGENFMKSNNLEQEFLKLLDI